MIQWADPERWVWLWLVPVLGVLWMWAFRERRRALERFSHSALLPQLTGLVDWRSRKLKAVMVTLALGCLLVALVGPQWGFRWQEIKRRGTDILIAVDVSNSMLAEDVRPNRLERAKLAIQDLLLLLRGERVGLIAFAGSSFVQVPLTVDYGAFSLALEELSPDTIPVGGTGFAQVLRYSLTAFAESVPESRALVLMTDGEDHIGDGGAAAEELGRAGIKIFTIGIGTPEGELIPITDEQGQRRFLKDPMGRTVKTRLKEEVLQEIAEATGGRYVRNAASSLWLELLYREELGKLEPQESENPMKKQPVLRFQWALAVALILLTLEPFLSERKRGTV